jgi:hypothetical protein
MSNILFNINVQPVIIAGAGNKPTVPSPSTLRPDQAGWLTTDIMKGEVAYNPDDNIFYYRNDSDVIEELTGGTTDMDLMIEGSTNLILSGAERTKLAGIQAGATVSDSIQYFVDTINGDDYNDGLSSESPVQTWAKIYEIVSANSTVWVARGSYFTGVDYPDPADVPVEGGHTESYFIAGGMATVINGINSRWQGVTVDCYGSGNLPMFDLRLILDNANFVKQGGYTNIYRIDFDRVQMDNFGNVYGGIWEDGREHKEYIVEDVDTGTGDQFLADEAACLAQVDSEAGTFYWSHPVGVQGSSYYIHLHDSGNPITNSKDYRCRYFDWFVVNEPNANDGQAYKGVIIKNCKTIGNCYHMGAIWGKNIDCYNVTVMYFARHGYSVHGYSEDVTVIRGNQIYGGACFHGQATYNGEGRNNIHRRCTAVNRLYKDEERSSIAGFFYHGQPGSSFNTIEYHDCTVIGCDEAFRVDSLMKYVKITNPRVYGTKGFFSSVNPSYSTRMKVDVNGGEMIANDIANEKTFISVGNIELNMHNFKCFYEGNSCVKIFDTEDAILNFYDCMMVFKNAPLSNAVFRLFDNYGSPTIRFVNCVFPSDMLGSQSKFMEVESGDDPTLYIENTHFGDWEILGETDLMVLNYSHPGVSYLTSQIGLADMLEGNPRYAQWSIDRSVLDVRAGAGILHGNAIGYFDVEDMYNQKIGE